MHDVLHVPIGTARQRAAAVAVTAVLALLLLLLGAAPADARSSFMSRASGVAASTYWTQVDGTPTGTSALGNVHIGDLYAYETTKGKADVFGFIEDWDCEEGELPWGGGPHAADEPWPPDEEPPPPGGCEWKGFRFIESSDVPFSVDKKLSQARLTGTLTVYGGGHGEEGVVGRPYADVIWNGVGDVTTEKFTFRYREGGTTYTSTYESTSRGATMAGVLGPMGFDPDLSGGWISNFKTSTKERTK